MSNGFQETFGYLFGYPQSPTFNPVHTQFLIRHIFWKVFNQFYATGVFCIPPKTENQRYYDISHGYRKKSMAWGRLKSNFFSCQWLRGTFIAFYMVLEHGVKKLDLIFFLAF